MAGLPLPTASNMQPLGSTTPRSNIYEAREVNIGRVQGQFSGGPQIISGVGEGLKGLAGGLDKWAAVLEQQEQERQQLEAIETMSAAQDEERAMLEQMSQMTGSAGYDAPGMAEKFYKDLEGRLMGKARGDFQRGVFAKALAGMRDQGLNKAVTHRISEHETRKNQVWAGQEALALDAIEQDPSQLNRKLMEMDELENQLEPGMAPELRQARSSARWKKGLALSIATLTESGEFDQAEQLVQSGRGGQRVRGAEFALPTDSHHHITSPFGPRAAPSTPQGKGSADHQSIDLRMPSGTPIKAISGGTVSFSGTKGGYGTTVIIKHDDGSTTSQYAHLSKLNVPVGTRVNAGDVIALSGNSGKSTGPHLDLKVAKNGQYVDPAPLLGISRGGKLSGALENMQGQAGATQLSAEQKNKYMDYIGQERVKTQVRTLTAEVGQSFENDIRVDALNTVQKGYDEIAKISDPERRQEALSMYQQEVRFQDMRVNAADSTAVEGFFTMSEQMGWSPEKQLEMLKEIPELSRETREKLKDGIITGTANKPTVENEMAEQDLMVMISDRMRANNAMSETEIKALANQADMTVSQTSSALKYARGGGLAGDSAFATNVKELFNELSGDPKAKMPPGFVNMVFAKMDPGQSGRDAERQGVIRVMQAMAAGESNTGYIFDTGETAAQAQTAGRLGIWTPKVTRDEKAGIDAALQANGLKLTGRNRELWKKSEQLGLPLTQAELNEVERQ